MFLVLLVMLLKPEQIVKTSNILSKGKFLVFCNACVRVVFDHSYLVQVCIHSKIKPL